ncbi:DUF3575 domain-containing protein [Alkalitalea saponilacus]|uniref:Outer membrane protein beta-barrel domain-containing protein n=1 Tax=Alkalitalea saponilacus TaxID=889453 RepID=A0A1T5HT26_9BACT|nr:DUF3575 domain-containing protein [Alkalitalea saponilacus]ASB47674.1 hypothetical protein CDL62_00150 [Alkalitalea saponilacus]SKC23817.1 Protein of unknown function [Alkalitalea saponilacus]
MNRKIGFLVIALLCAVSFSATAQQAVKLGPLGFLFGNYNLRYEKALSEKGSWQVGANYYNYEIFDVTSTGFGLDAAYRNYFKEAMVGAYVSPALGFQTNTTSVSVFDDTSAGYSLLGLGVTLGYQWIGGGGFVTDLGLGYGYNVEVGKDDKLTGDFGGGGVRFTFAIGYAF